jgi:lysophospholipid acyltransferase (LPLAT)-like uncharacterized protein
LRIDRVNEAQWLKAVDAGGRVLICTWHQQFFVTVRAFRKYRDHDPALMISRSRDGDFVAEIARLNGWQPVRGSSSKGGVAALSRMIKSLRRGRIGGHLVDGPRGPAGRVKPGTIRLAQAADAAIVPFTVSADRVWYCNSWDHFMVPKPFARVTITFHDPLPVERTRDPRRRERQRRDLEKVLRGGLKCF